ncbi:hypothetical protein Ancab_025689 [Ancistrocladus abbreviatus]
MIPLACQNIEIRRIGFDGIACGCSSNASFDCFSAKNNVKAIQRSFREGHGARKLLYLGGILVIVAFIRRGLQILWLMVLGKVVSHFRM